MAKIYKMCKTMLTMNETDIVNNIFKQSNTPVCDYLKCVEYLNQTRREYDYDRSQFTYIDIIANNFHLKLLSEVDLDKLFVYPPWSESECSYLYNMLVSVEFLKSLINTTWLEIILNKNGKYKQSFELNSNTSCNKILIMIMKYYTEIKKINTSMCDGNDTLQKFTVNENLIQNKTLMQDFIKYLEAVSRNTVPMFIKCLLYNYQTINMLGNSVNNRTGIFEGDIKQFYNIEPTYYTTINKSQFSLHTHIISYIKYLANLNQQANSASTAYDNEYTRNNNENRYDEFEYLNDMTAKYLNAGILFLGDCNEGMGYCTHLVYDMNIKRFLIFIVGGSNGYDCLGNDNKINEYINMDTATKYTKLDGYFSKYDNYLILDTVLNKPYNFMYDNNNKIKSALLTT